jgi:RNA polymerase sigma factor (sigma-70 family)
MDQKANFSSFISSLIKGEESAYNSLFEHIEIIMIQWGQKNKMELCWTSNNGQLISSKELAKSIGESFLVSLHANLLEFHSYSDYKKKVSELIFVYIDKSFKEFNELLISSNNSAWKVLNEQLRIYTARWYYNRQNFIETEVDELYSSAISVLFENISAKALKFTDSYGLKSYYFRILENKTLEANRKLKSQSKLQLGFVEEQFSSYPLQNENEEIILKLHRKMSELTEIEKRILIHYYWNEKRLNEIAEELRISFENCRVIKHRAIQKIAKSFAMK